MKKEVPWCTILLVAGTITMHSLVLCGNLATSAAFKELGRSTHGWSTVGTMVSDSLGKELDVLMNNVSSTLTNSLRMVIGAKAAISTAMQISGTLMTPLETNLSISQPSAPSSSALYDRFPLAQSSDDSELFSGGLSGLSSLTVCNAARKDNDVGLFHLGSYCDAGARTSIESASTESQDQYSQSHVKTRQQMKAAVLAQIANSTATAAAASSVDKFFQVIHPALMQIGKWLTTFGEAMQTKLEEFSTMLDRVQKLFDQIMAKISGAATGEDIMIHNTYNLFDMDHTGLVSIQDLKDVAASYGISALDGKKSEELHQKYDADKDHELSVEEYRAFTKDTTVPNIMAVVLRAYAKRLVSVAGNVAAARMRDEVALAVVDYSLLMASKNMTKISWIANRLTNGSIPLAFTADFLIQLARAKAAPNQLTTADNGQIVVSEMVFLEPNYVNKAVDRVMDPSFWRSEGFDLDEQPSVAAQVTKWVEHANKHGRSTSAAILSTTYRAHVGAQMLVERRLQILQQQDMEEQIQTWRALTASESHRQLVTTLVGSTYRAAALTAQDPAVDQVVNSGVPAVPATLEFAAFLSSNATATSSMFQSICFDYAQDSSSSMDSFANQVNGFIKRLQSFLNTMMKYSTPRAITEMETNIKNFVKAAATDMVTAAEHSMNKTEALLQLSGGAVAPPPVAVNLTGVFQNVITLLDTMQVILPTVISDLKNARTQVSALSSSMNNIFVVFKAKGPPIFDLVSSLYKVLWVVYYVLLAGLTAGVLFYGFWAGGYCGGPTPDEDEAYTPPQSFYQRCAACCRCCTMCLQTCHDNHLCFWSGLIFAQVFVLILFLVSILLCVLAGVKTFMVAGCSLVYPLGDGVVCTQTLKTLRNFLTTFWPALGNTLLGACDQNKLLTCQLIGEKLKNSTIMTIIGSMGAAVFSLQMVLDSACLHERRRNVKDLALYEQKARNG